MSLDSIEPPAAGSNPDGIGDILGRRGLAAGAVQQATATVPPRQPVTLPDFWSLGYTRLLTVIPAEQPIRSAGKRPGRRGLDGRWFGESCRKFDATPDLLPTWQAMGGGIGLRFDRDHVAIDIEVGS